MDWIWPALAVVFAAHLAAALRWSLTGALSGLAGGLVVCLCVWTWGLGAHSAPARLAETVLYLASAWTLVGGVGGGLGLGARRLSAAVG